MSVFADFIIRFINLLILFVIVVNYIVTSKMLYNIGKKLGVSKSGFAWVPVKADLILADISERLNNDGESAKNYSKKLRYSSVAAADLLLLTLFVIVFSFENIQHVLFIREVTIVFSAFIYMMFMVCIILFMIRFFAARMCVYNVFKYAQPDKALKYLVLSFIIPLAKAFLLRKCKNKICTDYESEKTECVSDELQNN